MTATPSTAGGTYPIARGAPPAVGSGLDGAEELEEEAAVDRLVAVLEGLEGGVAIGVVVSGGGGGHGLRGAGAEHRQLPGDLIGVVVDRGRRLVEDGLWG